jgi:DNA-binding beta-propeller fold protein YncE
MPRSGSTVALATGGGRVLAYVADEDDWTVHVVDLGARKRLAETPLEGRPSQLMFLPDGRLVVLLRDKSQVLVLEARGKPEQLERRCAVDTAPEPVGLALTPDDSTLLVTSGWGRALTAFDALTFARSFQLGLAREPRSVVVTDDGRFAYVSHAVGAKASRVDLRTKTVAEIPLRGGDPQHTAETRAVDGRIEALKKSKRAVPQALLEERQELEKGTQPSCQGYALAKSTEPSGRILAPQVLVDTGDPAQRAPGYGNDSSPTEAPDVAVIDAATGKPMTASLERPLDSSAWGIDPRDTQNPQCLLPRASAVDPRSTSLLVSCFGIDQVIAYDALAASPTRAERQRWSVGGGPSGIAVDPARNRALVWSQFDRALYVLDLGDGALVDDRGRPRPAPVRIDMPPNPARRITVAASLGRLLFHSVGDARVSKDGRACASCHPDGRDDSLVWATPDGPRRSIMLAGRVTSTAPYAWNGTEADLREHLATTFDRLNGAGGLKSVELDALMAYVESLAPPPALSTSLDAKARRGEQLFASNDVGCARCHAGSLGTDNLRHDVKSKNDADRTAIFNTPTLHFVGGTGPYFHDGRYATLHELLTANKDTMGHTTQLLPDDVDALEAYVRTL